jgi:hypothetical protein
MVCRFTLCVTHKKINLAIDPNNLTVELLYYFNLFR